LATLTGTKNNYCSISKRRTKLLAVLLGAPGVLERDLWASELLDLGFSKIGNLPPVNVTKDQLMD